MIEAHNSNHRSTGTIGAKQLDDLLDKTMKEFDDKYRPVINSLNLSLVQQKETLRKLSMPNNSGQVLYGQTSTPVVEQNSSSEERPETEFVFWETKVEDHIAIWSTILRGIENKEVCGEKFISLQVQFLKNIREEMGDSKLFDEWLDWHKKKYPKRQFEAALSRM